MFQDRKQDILLGVEPVEQDLIMDLILKRNSLILKHNSLILKHNSLIYIMSSSYDLRCVYENHLKKLRKIRTNIINNMVVYEKQFIVLKNRRRQLNNNLARETNHENDRG